MRMAGEGFVETWGTELGLREDLGGGWSGWRRFLEKGIES